MRYIFLAVLTVLLSGCQTTFLGASVEEEPVAIVWHQVDDPHKECQKLSGVSLFKILGCSTWSDEKTVAVGVEQRGSNRVCHIYAKRPQSSKDEKGFGTLGHEMMHCFEGNWHDKYGRMEPSKHKVEKEAL